MSTYIVNTMPTLGALLAVLALVLLAGRLAKLTGAARMLSGSPRQGARLRVQDTRALDRARRLHIIRCDGRDLLLLTGGPGDLAVGWLPLTENAP